MHQRVLGCLQPRNFNAADQVKLLGYAACECSAPMVLAFYGLNDASSDSWFGALCHFALLSAHMIFWLPGTNRCDVLLIALLDYSASISLSFFVAAAQSAAATKP
jgi:hypothetical protein